MPNPFHSGQSSPEDPIRRTNHRIHAHATCILPIYTTTLFRRLSPPPLIPWISSNIRRRPPTPTLQASKSKTNPHSPQRTHHHRRRTTNSPYTTPNLSTNIHRPLLPKPTFHLPTLPTHHRRRATHPPLTSPLRRRRHRRPPPITLSPAPQLGNTKLITHELRFTRRTRARRSCAASTTQRCRARR